MNGMTPSSMPTPLENVFASTFLGSEKFVEWAKEKWIGFKNADERNIPALKQIKGRPSIEDIENSLDVLENTTCLGKYNPFRYERTRKRDY